MKSVNLALSILLAAHGRAHFIVQYPESIGYNDLEEGTPPCGGFDITKRDPLVEFSVRGLPISLLSTHPESLWEFQAYLLNDTNNALYLVAPIRQTGYGSFCLPQLLGPADWVGEEGVVQISQKATDGQLFQCLSVKYVDGPAEAQPSICKNSSLADAHFESLPDGATLITPVADANSASGAGNNGNAPTEGGAQDGAASCLAAQNTACIIAMAFGLVFFL